MYKFFVRVSLVALSTLTVVGCTTVDDTLGLEMVPGDQQMQTLTASFSGIDCYITQNDSVPSGNKGQVFFGTTYSETFGVTEASAVLQYLPGGFKDKEAGFGYRPVADSLNIYFDITAYNGKPVADGQKFYIYKVNKKIESDTTYYSDFDATTIVDVTPIFEFNITNKLAKKYIRLTPIGADGEAFLQSLITEDKATYDTDSIFQRVFKGLYIAPETDVNKDKEIFRADLVNTHLLLKGHNHDKDKLSETGIAAADGSDNKDTLSMAYYVEDTQYTLNTSINCIKHDYTGTPIAAHLNDTTKTATPLTKVYVQSLSGVTTYLRLTDEFINSMISAMNYDNTKFSSMAINKAEIRFYMDEFTTPMMNAAPTRLGMYYNYRALKTIPDYAYQYETQGAIAYDGYLNRSQGFYSMDLSSYIQQLMINPKMQRTIFLAPDINVARAPVLSLGYNFGEVVLKAPSADPDKIEVRVTYTLIK